MAKKTAKDPADYILPLYMNGLHGRMMCLPAPKNKKRELLFIYGQHSSLERWWGVAQALNKYGAVTIPDLPGFGGMDSLYKIGQKATIDNLADYLAAFLKLRYKRKKVIIVGMSLGFPIVTRMLQRYPDLTKKVDMLVSVVGLCHKDDFVFTPVQMRRYRFGARLFATRIGSAFYQNVFASPVFIRNVYKFSKYAKDKLQGKGAEEFQKAIEAEVILWKINDIRTQMRTNVEMMTLDNTKKKVGLPVYHVSVDSDRYFNNVKVEEHMRLVFPEFNMYTSTMESHAPSYIADMESAAAFLPKKLTRILSKS